LNIAPDISEKQYMRPMIIRPTDAATTSKLLPEAIIAPHSKCTKSKVPKNSMDRNARNIRHPEDREGFSEVGLVPMEIRTFKIIVE